MYKIWNLVPEYLKAQQTKLQAYIDFEHEWHAWMNDLKARLDTEDWGPEGMDSDWLDSDLMHEVEWALSCLRYRNKAGARKGLSTLRFMRETAKESTEESIELWMRSEGV